MNASVWAPGTSISANSSIKSQSFTATAGQTLFNLTAFSYALNSGSLYVFVAGGLQRPLVDFTETSVSSFTLTTGAQEGAIVVALGFVEVSGDAGADQLRAELASTPGSSLVGNTQPGTGALLRTVQDREEEQMRTTDFSTIQQAINSKVAIAGGGVISVVANATPYSVTTTISLPDYTVLEGEGYHSTGLKLANSSNVALLESEDFQTLTGSGIYLASLGNKVGFGLRRVRLDGNKANQTAGNVVNFYGKNYILDEVLITSGYGVGLYSENPPGTVVLPWTEIVEGFINKLWVMSCGSHGIHFKGPHDTRMDNIFTFDNVGDGIRIESDGVLTQAVCDIGFIHTYGNDGLGMYAANVPIKAELIQAESNDKEGLYLVATADRSLIGSVQLFGNDYQQTGTYFNGLFSSAETTIGQLSIEDSRGSAGGFKINGDDFRIGNAEVKNTGNTQAAAVGAYIDGNSVSVSVRVADYTTAGQTGMLSNNTSRAHQKVIAYIQNCYTGWNNVNAGVGNNYDVDITTTNKNHLLFTGAGPSVFDPGSGGLSERETWNVYATNSGVAHTGTAAGGSATTIVFPATADAGYVPSARDDVYNGCIINITAGTGINNYGVITDYVGSTRTATVQRVNSTTGAAWTADATSVYNVATLRLRSNTNGNSAVANGNVSQRIAHGLLVTSNTPTFRNIKITPTNNLGTATKMWVGAVDAYTFSVTVDANPGASTAAFSWHAELTP